MIRTRPWLAVWLEQVRARHAEHATPAPLRQSTWCAHGLHGTCTGTAHRRGVDTDCRCPCHPSP